MIQEKKDDPHILQKLHDYCTYYLKPLSSSLRMETNEFCHNLTLAQH